MPRSVIRSTVLFATGPLDLSFTLPDGADLADRPYPAVLIAHDGIGVTPALHALADRLADAGYAVLIPDLFTRDRLRRTVSDAEVVRHLPLVKAVDRAAAIAEVPREQRDAARRVLAWADHREPRHHLADLRHALAWLSERPEVDPAAVAAIGFSLGGGLVGGLAAAGDQIAAGVIFYGRLPPAHQISGIGIPLLGHFASDDPGINATLEPFAIAAALRGVPFDYEIHPGTAHGFASEIRPSHSEPATQCAWERTIGFLDRALHRRSAALIARLGPPIARRAAG